MNGAELREESRRTYVHTSTYVLSHEGWGCLLKITPICNNRQRRAKWAQTKWCSPNNRTPGNWRGDLSWLKFSAWQSKNVLPFSAWKKTTQAIDLWREKCNKPPREQNTHSARQSYLKSNYYTYTVLHYISAEASFLAIPPMYVQEDKDHFHKIYRAIIHRAHAALQCLYTLSSFERKQQIRALSLSTFFLFSFFAYLDTGPGKWSTSARPIQWSKV